MGFGPRSSPATLPNMMSFGLRGATGGTALDFAAALRACTRSLNKDVAAAAPNARRLAIIAIFDLYGGVLRESWLRVCRDSACPVQNNHCCAKRVWLQFEPQSLQDDRSPDEHAPGFGRDVDELASGL